MASQITHIVLADKLYPELFSKFEKGSFYAGNIFPDIRYLKVISREVTHPKISSVRDILAQNDPFKAGMLLHGLVDLVREEYVVAHSAYDFCPQSDYVTQTLKLYEDEFYYTKVADWGIIAKILDYSRADFVIPQDKIDFWYASMKKYFVEGPTDASRKEVIMKLGFPEAVANKINLDISEIRNNEKMGKLLANFYLTLKEQVTNVYYS